MDRHTHAYSNKENTYLYRRNEVDSIHTFPEYKI